MFFSLYIFYEEHNDRAQNTIAVKANAISRSWQTLARRGLGDFGKGAAIEYLLSVGENISHLDLSCETISRGIGIYQDVNRECKGNPSFNNLNLTHNIFDKKTKYEVEQYADNLSNGADEKIIKNTNFSGAAFYQPTFENIFLYASNFKGASFTSSKLENVAFYDVNFIGTDWKFVNINNSNLRSMDLTNSTLNGFYVKDAEMTSTDFSNATIINSSFTNVYFNFILFENVKMQNVSFYDVNFSNVYFANNSLENVLIEGAWTWSDAIPKNFPTGYELQVCQAPNNFSDKDGNPIFGQIERIQKPKGCKLSK